MRASASASSSQATQIRRQIAALRAVEREQGCTAEKAAAGGLFNACRGLAQRRAKAERQLAQASGGGRNNTRLMARYESLGCDARQRPAQKERTAKSDRPKSSGWKYAGSALFYCVRPSDGYLFPAPQSQFAKKDYATDAIDQCRFVCDDDSMALYVLEDPELETEEMVSVATNKPYSELPTAFRYQDEGSFKRCDWSRYFARVNELRARTVTPRNLANVIIPIPQFRPEPETDFVSSIGLSDPTESMKGEIRIVGPMFLPDEESKFRAGPDVENGRNTLANTVEVLIKLR